MGCIKLKSFCTSKETVTKIKRQHTEWKKILVSYSTNKGINIHNIQKAQKTKQQKTVDPTNELQMN
jgi:hypothetical protein